MFVGSGKSRDYAKVRSGMTLVHFLRLNSTKALGEVLMNNKVVRAGFGEAACLKMHSTSREQDTTRHSQTQQLHTTNTRDRLSTTCTPAATTYTDKRHSQAVQDEEREPPIWTHQISCKSSYYPFTSPAKYSHSFSSWPTLTNLLD